MTKESSNLRPLISIVTVVLNGENHIERAIKSVSLQRYDNIEHIIIDGQSTDNTLNIIQQYESVLGIIISEPDKGLYDAMNKGIRLAKGELIGILNSDDWYEPDAIEIIVAAYQRHKDKHIFHANCFYITAGEGKQLIKHNSSTLKFLYYSMTYVHPSMFITKSEYSRHLYNDTLSVHSDYQFVLEAFLERPEVFLYLEQTIVNYSSGGISGKLSIRSSLSEGFIARRAAGLDLPRTIVSLLVRFLGKLYARSRGRAGVS